MVYNLIYLALLAVYWSNGHSLMWERNKKGVKENAVFRIKAHLHPFPIHLERCSFQVWNVRMEEEDFGF